MTYSIVDGDFLYHGNRFMVVVEVHLSDLDPASQIYTIRRMYDEEYLARREPHFLYGEIRELIVQCAHVIRAASPPAPVADFMYHAYSPAVSTMGYTGCTGPTGPAVTGYTGEQCCTGIYDNQRARELLMSCLSSEQRRDFENDMSFETRGSDGGTYRVINTSCYNVLKKKRWNKAIKLCTSHNHTIPTYDTMLAQKLMIETDERKFLSIANKGKETSWRQE